MTLPFRSLRRALLAGALALALAGCSLQEAGPSAVMLSGGGAISSDLGAASQEEPAASSGSGSSQPREEDVPSFQELPSPPESSSGSGQTVPPPSSGASSSSSTPPPSSSSSPPPPSSREEPEEPKPEDDEDDNEDEDEEPVRRPGGSGGSGAKPPASSSSQPDPEPEPEEDPESEPEPEPEEDEPSGGGSGWQTDLKVRYNGSTVSDSAVSIVARMVENEVGYSFPDEAIKAQAVAAYTFVRYHNSTGSIPSVGLKNPTDKVTRLVKEVAGEQLTYNGSPILSTYCAMSAGWTASSRSVWGTSLPYLTPVESEGDETGSGFSVTVTKPVSEVQGKLEKALKIDLDGVDPGDWFDILSYWDDGPYVNKVSIGGIKETTGRVIRESILGLRSAAFEVEYDEGSGNFVFTTYGYGHGVGMSQVGAKYYANQGWDHVEILEHYYPGATVE